MRRPGSYSAGPRGAVSRRADPRDSGGRNGSAGFGGGDAPAAAELTEEALEAWGRRLGSRAVETSAFVALRGPLGAGKTRLVQAACRGAGVDEPVLSPTFTLVHTYAGRSGPVHHVDLYRIRDPEELAELGWHDLLAGDAPVFVEWAERAGPALPLERWEVRLEMGSLPDTRRVEVAAVGGALPVPPPCADGRADVAEGSG